MPVFEVTVVGKTEDIVRREVRIEAATAQKAADLAMTNDYDEFAEKTLECGPFEPDEATEIRPCDGEE